jgi:copper chaperone CopZ
MDPKIWGGPAWIFLHSVTFNYPKNPTLKEKDAYRVYFNSLKEVLPCGHCKNNLKKNLKKNPIDKALKSRDNLINWLIDIHNQVNIDTEKKIISKKEAINYYVGLYRNNNDCYKYLFVGLLMIFIIIYIYIKKYK